MCQKISGSMKQSEIIKFKLKKTVKLVPRIKIISKTCRFLLLCQNLNNDHETCVGSGLSDQVWTGQHRQ